MRGMVLFCLVSALLAPTAAGQGPLAPPALEIDPVAPVGPIEPNVGKATLAFDHRLNCDWDRAQLVAAGEATVMHEVTSTSAQVVVTGSLTRPVDTSPCATPTTTSIPFTADFEVEITSNAPGETPIGITLSSWVHTVHTGSSDPVEATARVQASYLGVLSVNIPATIMETVKGKATFDLEITNLGNSRSMIVLTPSVEPGVDVDVPEPFVLESPTQGGKETTRTVPVTVRMSGGETVVKVMITPASTRDGQEGQSVTINLLVRDGSFLGKVESPAPMLVIPFVLGAALAARFRHATDPLN